VDVSDEECAAVSVTRTVFEWDPLGWLDVGAGVTVASSVIESVSTPATVAVPDSDCVTAVGVGSRLPVESTDAESVGERRLRVFSFEEVYVGDCLLAVTVMLALRDSDHVRTTDRVFSDRDSVPDVPGVAVSLSWMDAVGVVDALWEQVRDKAGDAVRLIERRE
jgi:hypothetical protein